MLKGVSRKAVLIRVLVVILTLSVGVISALELKEYLARNTPHENVLVAKSDILPYAVVRREYLAYKRMPVGSMIEGSIQDPKQVIGKKATMTIYKGEQILPQKLADSPLTLTAEDGAVGVPIDIIRAAGLSIRPGDKVDVYWIPKAQQELISVNQSIKEINEAQKIAAKATVLDILSTKNTSVFNNFLANDNKQKSENTENAPKVAVIKVKNKEVKDVVTAVGNGSIYLVKRQ